MDMHSSKKQVQLAYLFSLLAKAWAQMNLKFSISATGLEKPPPSNREHCKATLLATHQHINRKADEKWRCIEKRECQTSLNMGGMMMWWLLECWREGELGGLTLLLLRCFSCFLFALYHNKVHMAN
jgi:hypothetical protein